MLKSSKTLCVRSASGVKDLIKESAFFCNFGHMTFDEFTASLQQVRPPRGVAKALEALWYDGKGDWEAAHDIAQAVLSPTGSWVHAYLHRKEGDDGNAAYWYRQAGKPFPRISLEQEWQGMVTELLAN